MNLEQVTPPDLDSPIGPGSTPVDYDKESELSAEERRRRELIIVQQELRRLQEEG